MKFNLKNFPKPKVVIYPKEKHHAIIVDMLLWKKGFEKELRTDVTSKYISEWRGHVDALIWLIKEILGE